MSIQVGDRVRIVNQGKLYSSYSDWMIENGLSRNNWTKNAGNQCDYGTVIHIAKHNKESPDFLALVRTDIGKDFIYGVEGLRKVEEKATMKHPKLNFSRPMITTATGSQVKFVGNAGGRFPYVLAIQYETLDPDVVSVNEFGCTYGGHTPYVKNVAAKKDAIVYLNTGSSGFWFSKTKQSTSVGSAKVTLEEGVWAENDEPKPC